METSPDRKEKNTTLPPPPPAGHELPSAPASETNTPDASLIRARPVGPCRVIPPTGIGMTTPGCDGAADTSVPVRLIAPGPTRVETRPRSKYL
jgi:hypothetical protein